MLGTALSESTVQVSPFRRGKDLQCSHTGERPDLSRELPNWMFGAAFGDGTKLAPPETASLGSNS